jgi:carbonic anhydrase
MNVKEIKDRLISGNQNYINDKENLSSDNTLRISLTSGQQPFAIILSCADSRVVPEMIFDCNIGELFVVRVAGNIANKSSAASIEYAVAHLNCKMIVVLGHESCGAVTAAVQGGDNGPNLNHLCDHISSAVSMGEGKELAEIIKINAANNASDLVKNSSIISDAVNAGNLTIESAYYNLGSGKVEFT